jgi:hypothetical protein
MFENTYVHTCEHPWARTCACIHTQGEWALSLSQGRQCELLASTGATAARMKDAMSRVRRFCEDKCVPLEDVQWSRIVRIPGVGEVSVRKDSARRCNGAVAFHGTPGVSRVLFFFRTPEHGPFAVVHRYVPIQELRRKALGPCCAPQLSTPDRRAAAAAYDVQVGGGDRTAVCNCARGFAGTFCVPDHHMRRSADDKVLRPLTDIAHKVILIPEYEVFCWGCMQAAGVCTCDKGDECKRAAQNVWVSMPVPEHHASRSFTG